MQFNMVDLVRSMKAEHFSIPKKWHGFGQHIKIKVPPLAIAIFKQNKRRIKEEEIS